MFCLHLILCPHGPTSRKRESKFQKPNGPIPMSCLNDGFSRYEIPPAERVTVAAPRATTLTQVDKDDHVGCMMYKAIILRIVKR